MESDSIKPLGITILLAFTAAVTVCIVPSTRIPEELWKNFPASTSEAVAVT